MEILVSRTLYMSCQAGPGIEPGPSVLKASALPIELTWHCMWCRTIRFNLIHYENIIAPLLSIFYRKFKNVK